MVKKEGDSEDKGSKKKKKKTKKSFWKFAKIVLIIAALVLLIYFAWNWFFAYKECLTWDCFNTRLEKCEKTEFIGGNKMVFEYVIRGKTSENGEDKCLVDVVLLQGDLNNQDSLKLEGHGMECKLPYGAVVVPESNIGNCHGLLKEGLQDLIIGNLHEYIVQNLGRINLEVLDVPK